MLTYYENIICFHCERGLKQEKSTYILDAN